MAEPQHLRDIDEPREGWREILSSWGPAILAVIFIRLFLFEPFRIPSGSMVPTLLIGDHVLVTKFSYGLWLPFKSIGIPFSNYGLTWDNIELIDWGDPERGDVIVFHYPRDENITFIKRVVGVPGDVIRVVDNQIILNGERQELIDHGDYEDINAACRTRRAKRYTERLLRTDGTVLDHGILTDRVVPGVLSNHREITVPPDAVFVMGDNRDQSEDGRRWGMVKYEQIKGKAHFVWLSWDGCEGMFGTLRTSSMFRSLYAADAPDAAPVRPDN